MLKKLIRENRRAFFLNFIIIFLSISVVYLGVTLFFQSESNRLKQVEIRTAEESIVNTEKYFITYKINRLVSDLQFTSDTLSSYFPDDGDFSDVQNIWLAFSNRRGIYDQIRYLNRNGDEIVRINFRSHAAYVVAPDELQNKKSRYFFLQTLPLGEKQVYISPLYLNIENNQIEQPLNPVIRLGAPFFDADGQKNGIVVLNYAANDMLSQIKTIASASNGDVFLLNTEGYWLYNKTSPEKEWAFMYGAASSVSFAAEYPEEWSVLQNGDSGTFHTTNGFFSYTKLQSENLFQSDENHVSLSCETGSWYIVAFIPSSSAEGIYFQDSYRDLLIQVLQRYYAFYLIILFFSAVFSVFIVSNRSKSEQVKFFSEYDVMTGALNRHAGIVRLSALYKALAKNNCMTSVCFLDVNGLKEVNDSLGHEAGDELLITVANVIRSGIRADDFVIRLGGDEFLIVFTRIGEELAEQAWKRIVAAFDSINQTENRRYVISVSHGIETLSCSVNPGLDLVLHQADTKMYEEKKRIKGTLRIIRP